MPRQSNLRQVVRSTLQLWVVCLALLAGEVTAQANGEVVSLEPIADFVELVEYVRASEGRAAPALSPERYGALDEIELFGLTYWSDGLRVKGFLLKPRAAGRFPAIIYNRGGSLEYGSLTHRVASVQLGELAILARAGYVVVASQYRGNGGGREGHEEYMGSDLQDVLSLVDLLAARPDVDAERIGMFGWSRGGATTFRCLTESRRIKAAAVGGPAVNYPRIIAEEPHMGEYWSEFIPGYHDDPQGVMAARSVLYWVGRLPKNVPVLIVHGAADKKVKTPDILTLAMRMEEHRLPYRLVIYEGGDHGLTAHRQEAFGQIIGWFDRHLKAG
ncbi:MAG: prolyl oligopeptidase family serine peptidase [Acidobacteriota bacterium]